MLSKQVVVLQRQQQEKERKRSAIDGPLFINLFLFALSRVQNGKRSGSRPIVKRIEGVKNRSRGVERLDW